MGRSCWCCPALALEYEAVCRDPGQRIASGLSEAEVETIVTALCAVAEPVVTFNRQDFGQVPGRFGIALLLPQGALRRLSP